MSDGWYEHIKLDRLKCMYVQVSKNVCTYIQYTPPYVSPAGEQADLDPRWYDYQSLT
jgi:hypothetical protein